MIQFQYSSLLQSNYEEPDKFQKGQFQGISDLSSHIQNLNTNINEHYSSNSPTREFVIFAETDFQYNHLKELQYSKAYDQLLAIKIKLTHSDQSSLSKFFTSIYPFQIYSRATFHSNSIVNSKIKLDTVNEADFLGVSNLWDMGFNGQDVVVGIIDNGVNFNHPDLVNQEFASKNFTIPGATIRYSHGTPVAGIIAASGITSFNNRGTSFGAKIASANMGQSTEGYLVGDFLEAFDWLANISDVKIINTSWSGGGEDIWIPVVKRLEQLGILVVGAAGNEGSGILNVLGSPANSVHGLSVASSGPNGELSSFTSQGPIGGGFTKPDVIAPGQGIVSTNEVDSYSSFSGTSFSAPLVAGAIATLISGLENNSIPFNVGLLKSSIMKTSTNPNEYDENKIGQGIINATSAFDLIVSRAANNTSIVPVISTATPKQGFFSQLTNLRQNTNSEIPFTLISSVPENITLGTEGNITTIMELPAINQSLFSQAKFILTNTTNVDLGYYFGNITITDDFETIIIPIKVLVQEEPSFKVLFDLKHTSSDFGYTVYRAGYETGSFIEVINQQGGWVDLVDTTLTSNLLDDYDLLWLPDPFGILGLESSDITSQEINAIHDFVNAGGNLFIHYSGRFNDSLANSIEESIVGTDISQLNLILNPYDMQASGDNPDLINYFNSENNPISVEIYNNTILGRNISKITSYEPTQITIHGNAKPLTNNSILATWSQASSGRVLVSSTDSWFSSHSANNDQQSNDYRFMENVIDWLTIQPRIEIDNLIIEDRELNLEIHLTNNSEYIDRMPKVNMILNNEYVNETSLASLGIGKSLLIVRFDIDENYEIQISYEEEYIRFPIVIDTISPSVIPTIFKDKYSSSDNITFQFEISDNLSGVLEESITTLLDNVSYTEGNYNENTQAMTYHFQQDYFTKGSHEIVIQLSDNANNNVTATFAFVINGSNNNSETATIILLAAIIIIIGIRFSQNYVKSKK
ncbi:MAG: S8 family peptidase [Candidatus Kariarchaeaceae archaeon]